MSAELAVPHPPTTPAPTLSGAVPDKITYARELAASGLLPAAYRKQPANILWAIEFGEMLGLPPMAAINGVHVIEGKPTASAALMSALVRRAGHRLRVTGDDERAVCEITRGDDPEFVFRAEWTTERARKAGLTGKDVWKRYGAAMLKARAISECARDACEEALSGVHYTPEEAGAHLDGDGAPAPQPGGSGPVTLVTADQVTAEPDWAGLIEAGETAGDRDQLKALWRQVKQRRPDDAELLARIAAAGERVAARADPEPVAGDIVDDEPPPTEPDVKRREKRMHALLGEAGLGGSETVDRDARLNLLGLIVGRDVTTSAELTAADRETVISRLEQYQRDGDLPQARARAQEDAALADIDAARHTDPAGEQ